ncbi:hypothetical protein KKF25_03500, partial [Patescibacteria group bacterium]|nr:hypothetical protein [Patescibacteria group bacterium]
QEGKRIIARGIRVHPLVRKARRNGKILLKGGTTVSAISEELCGKPLKISGMITPKGTQTSKFKNEVPFPHSVILVGKKIIPLETREAWEKETLALTPEDLVVTGANAIDLHGHAAIMAGSYAGGQCLPSFQSLLIEGVPFLIAAGLEKLVPGNIMDLLPIMGRRKVDISYGMSVGLIPIFGRVFTEVQALETLAKVKVWVIAKGGILGAEGSSTLLIEGPETEILKIDCLYREVKGAGLSPLPRNLIPCSRGDVSCKNHIRCLYKEGKRI